MTFTASEFELEDDGYFTELGLADNPFQPCNFVIISFVNEPTAQDISLNQQGLFMHYGEHLDGYNLIRDIVLDGSELKIDLNDNEAGLADIPIALTAEVASKLDEAGAIELFRKRI